MLLSRSDISVWLFCLMLAGLGVGCSSPNQSTHPTVPTHAATGKVSYEDGSPVTSGIIEFTPLSGGLAARANISNGGTFSLSTIQDNGSITVGAKAGKYRVTVIQDNPDKRGEAGISSTQELTVTEDQNELQVTIPKQQ